MVLRIGQTHTVPVEGANTCIYIRAQQCNMYGQRYEMKCSFIMVTVKFLFMFT